MRSPFKRKGVASKSAVACCLTYLVAMGTLQCPRNAFQPETGFATKTIPQGAPLPTEHSKITILHGIGCSPNLSISYYCCSFVFWEYGCGLLSVGKQSIGKLCRMFGHPLLQKARTLGLGPPRPPPNQHNRFMYNRFQYTVPSHIKSCMAH